MKRKTSLLGGVRFVAESSADGHSDRFWALALANFGSKEADAKVELIAKKTNEFVW